MLVTLSRCSAICQSVAEVLLTGVVSLGAVSHRFIYLFYMLQLYNLYGYMCNSRHCNCQDLENVGVTNLRTIVFSMHSIGYNSTISMGKCAVVAIVIIRT